MRLYAAAFETDTVSPLPTSWTAGSIPHGDGSWSASAAQLPFKRVVGPIRPLDAMAEPESAL